MIKRTVTVKREREPEERDIAMLVQKASGFSSSVTVETGGKRINAKSIMGMMTLNVGRGDKVTVVTEGTDEEAAADEIAKYLLNL